MSSTETATVEPARGVIPQPGAAAAHVHGVAEGVRVTGSADNRDAPRTTRALGVNGADVAASPIVRTKRSFMRSANGGGCPRRRRSPAPARSYGRGHAAAGWRRRPRERQRRRQSCAASLTPTAARRHRSADERAGHSRRGGKKCGEAVAQIAQAEARLPADAFPRSRPARTRSAPRSLYLHRHQTPPATRA